MDSSERARCSGTVLCSLLSYLLVYQHLGDEGQFAGRKNPQADSSELDICCLLEHMEKNGAGDFSAVSSLLALTDRCHVSFNSMASFVYRCFNLRQWLVLPRSEESHAGLE